MAGFDRNPIIVALHPPHTTASADPAHAEHLRSIFIFNTPRVACSISYET
jgi:hypothetical protein